MNLFNRSSILVAGLVVAQMAVASTALAEAGDGLRSEGGWELSPSLRLTGRYNSNVYRASADDTASVLADAPLLGIEPAISILSPRERDFLFNLDGGVKWEQYIDASGDQTIDVSKQSGLSAYANVGAHINPTGVLSLKLDEGFNRKNEAAAFGGNEPYNWITNNLGAIIGLRPGGGILSFELGYHWKLYNFDNTALSYLDRNEHDFDLDIQWDFLPKTSLLLGADFTLVRWDEQFHPPVRDDLGLPPLTNVNSSPLRVQGGLSGLITERIALRAIGGYGWSMPESGPSFDGILGTVALSYAFGRLDLQNKLSAGYQRDFRTASVGNFYSMHQVFARYVQNLLDKRLSMNLGGRFEWRDYSADSAGLFGQQLNDELLIGEAGVGVEVADWLGLRLDYNLTANLTDNGYTLPAVDPTDPSITVLRDYVQHLVTLSATLKY